MKTIASIVALSSLLACSSSLYAQKSSGSWLFTPALVDVSTPNEYRSGLGSGVNLENFFYLRYVAAGLIVAQTAWSKYLDATGGYFKFMPRLGVGYINDDYTGFLAGVSYGLLVANNAGDPDDAVSYYDYRTNRSILIKEASYKSYSGTAIGAWAHLSINRMFAFDVTFDKGGDFTVSRVGFIFFYVITLNVAKISGPGISGIYLYPGFTLRMSII
jgi:hypothetical protein